MTQITMTELPENLQNLLTQAQKTGETLTIIQDGTPLAIISPLKPHPRQSLHLGKPQDRAASQKRASFGVMKNSTEIIGDIVEPVLRL